MSLILLMIASVIVTDNNDADVTRKPNHCTSSSRLCQEELSESADSVWRRCRSLVKSPNLIGSKLSPS